MYSLLVGIGRKREGHESWLREELCLPRKCPETRPYARIVSITDLGKYSQIETFGFKKYVKSICHFLGGMEEFVSGKNHRLISLLKLYSFGRRTLSVFASLENSIQVKLNN